MQHTATIVKDKNDVYHVRISKDGPQDGGDVELIEVLNQRDNETLEEFKERALSFVRETDA